MSRNASRRGRRQDTKPKKQCNSSQETECTESECVVFIDDSNIFIEGQKYFAKKHKLFVPQDPRFRIDIGKLLTAIIRGRDLCDGSTLYGSEPPARDTLWASIRDKGILVKTFHKDAKGQEKEVDNSLSVDAVAYVHKHKDKAAKQKIIIVAGDRDYCPAVEEILENGWKCEIFAFRSSLSSNIVAMNSAECTVVSLDEILNKEESNCCFIEAKWKSQISKVPHSRTQVLQLSRELLMDSDKEKPRKLAEEVTNITHIPCYYHLTKAEHPKIVFIIGCSPKKQTSPADCEMARQWKELVSKMGEEKAEEVFQILHKRNFKQSKEQLSNQDFMTQWNKNRDHLERKCDEVCKEHTPITYSDMIRFMQNRPDEELMKVENKFSVLSNLKSDEDVDDSEKSENELDDDDALSFVTANTEFCESTDTENESDADDDGSFVEVSPRKRATSRKYSELCVYSFRCKKGSNCKYTHREEEKNFFKTNSGKGRSDYKSKPCYKYARDRFSCPQGKDIAPMCAYYHSKKEAYCYICGESGHASHDKSGPECSKL